MKRYVVGFMFGDRNRVLLIKKSHPEWQKGKLNGIGGKVEEKETPLQAMVREFEEETGHKTTTDNWTLFAVISGDNRDSGDIDRRVYFYASNVDRAFDLLRNHDEQPVWLDWDNLPANCVYNLRYLIPLARDKDLQFPVIITDFVIDGSNGITSVDFDVSDLARMG